MVRLEKVRLENSVCAHCPYILQAQENGLTTTEEKKLSGTASMISSLQHEDRIQRKLRKCKFI
jgi:hypothetical protein